MVDSNRLHDVISTPTNGNHSKLERKMLYTINNATNKQENLL